MTEGQILIHGLADFAVLFLLTMLHCHSRYAIAMQKASKHAFKRVFTLKIQHGVKEQEKEHLYLREEGVNER